MKADLLTRFGDDLRRRRQEILARRDAADRGAREVHEGRTDPESEETAQADHAEYTLSRLSEAQAQELALIDAALARLEEGTFGTCVDCGQPISLPRLAALPYARRCAEDEEAQGAPRPRATL